MSAASLERTIRTEIPALKNAAFKISALSPLGIEVSAHLKDHLNHKGTAFGGSLYQTAIVASYGLFLHLLQSHGISTREFVIAKGQMKYRAPVRADFLAQANLTSEHAVAFLQKLQETGKADLNLNASITCEEKECARFEARFVAFFPGAGTSAPSSHA